ncbi:MAG TPA: hypothetical protein VHE55_03070 [Fimbriimonadaceae bacterium]|nr:hypothetical protein [Fimbriimonadaceae bacterium]
MRRRKRWPWVLVGILLGCPCLLTGVGLVVLKIGIANAGNTLPKELARARQAGLATEPADLRAELAIPASQNAAGDYRTAIAACKEEWPQMSPDMSLPHFLALKATPAEERTVRNLLDKTRRTIDLFEKASAKPAVDWGRPWEQGPDVLFPEQASMKSGVKLICAKAILAAKRGHTAEAFRLLSIGFRIGKHAGDDPTLIGLLVQIAVDGMCTSASCNVLNLRHDPASLTRAREMFESLPPIEDLGRAVGGEIVMERIGVQHLDRYAQQTGMGGSATYQAFPLNVLARDASFRRAVEAKAVHNQVLIYLATLKGKTWKQTQPAWKAAMASIDADKSLENIIAQDLVLDGIQDAPARATAYRRMLWAGIAVLSVYEKTHRLPAKLPDMGDNGLDPFSDKPLGYKLTADGFKVYSIDNDEVDDGGLSRAEDTTGKSNTHDIDRVFKVR